MGVFTLSTQTEDRKQKVDEVIAEVDEAVSLLNEQTEALRALVAEMRAERETAMAPEYEQMTLFGDEVGR